MRTDDGKDRDILGWLDADDRRAIFDEAAGAATDTGIAYWLVLVLAGAIALLGLALNSSAVVIGAMLIAPLLAPVAGLALGLAIGDGRLAAQTAAAVFVSTLAVIAIAAVLTRFLPFHDVTAEIAARTRPTTLDLAIAVFSGLAGAVVTVARGNRLAGAVPGVAVSVALVPPLAVAGFAIGTGGNWAVLRGSLLLYGANLAGIVMSAMLVFLVAGMHRPEVLAEVRRWHSDAPVSGLAAWAERLPGVRSLGVLRSLPARVILVLAFVALVAIPLSESLRQITRETRIQRGVQLASALFTAPGRSFIVSRDVTIETDRTRVTLNVATTQWFDDSTRQRFERQATAQAGEPVDLVLEQLPASNADLSHVATMIASHAGASPVVPPPSAGAELAAIRARVATALQGVALPDSVAILGFEITIGDSGSVPRLELRYLSPDTLGTQAREIVRRQVASVLQLPVLTLGTKGLSGAQRVVTPRSIATLDTLAQWSRTTPRLALIVTAGAGIPQPKLDSVVARLALGVDRIRIAVARDSSALVTVRPVLR